MVVHARGASEELGDAVWVVNVSSSWTESRHPNVFSDTYDHGAAQLSPDNRRLYLARCDAKKSRHTIQCVDLATRQELLTLRGSSSGLEAARWTADGDVRLAGPPWQAWRAPSWEEVAAAEAKDKAEAQRP